MNTFITRGAVGLAILSLTAFIGVNVIAYQQATDFITSTPEERDTDSPSLPYGPTMQDFEDVTVTTEDGVDIALWYVPGERDEAIIFVHGLNGSRGNMLDEMSIMHQEGYHVAALDLRSHGISGEAYISFGYFEANDIEAAYQYVSSQPGVDPDKVALYGESHGGSSVLHAAALNESFVAVAAHTPFASLEDTVDTSVQFFTGLPPFPFADLILFWATNRFDDLGTQDVVPIEWARQTNPRPVFVMVAGADTVVSSEQWLAERDTLGNHITMWYEPDIAHAAFDDSYPDEFAEQLISFYEESISP